ncbi:MAG: hypothetical protein ABSA41_15400 [Terriglobia bacterium]
MRKAASSPVAPRLGYRLRLFLMSCGPLLKPRGGQTFSVMEQKIEVVDTPRSRLTAPFFLVVADWDNRVFTVEGPMIDDTPWNKAVVRAQEAGRNVKCCNGGSAQDEAVSAYRRAYGLRFVEPGIIVHPRIDD